MPSLQISITFLFFTFSISPHFLSAATADTACNELTCSADSRPWVRFPFRLRASQPSRCGYSKAFNLFCDSQSRAIVTLPSSGRFVVQNIDYGDQNLWITDTQSCLPRRFLHGNFSLEGSPFSYVHAVQNFTFLNCSSDVRYPIIRCLSNVKRLVTAVPSFYTIPPFCFVISTALVPLENPNEWNGIHKFGLKLAWDAPNCHFCEAEAGNVCGRDINATKLICHGRTLSSLVNGPTYSSGLSRPKRYAIMTAFIGITALTVVLALRLKNRGPEHQPVVVELSSVYNDPQPHYSQSEPQPDPIAKTEHDDPTVDSSAKVYELGESKPSDSTCPICLRGYSPKDILRTISECNHYFHAGCVDEWLRTNGTCPLCRKTTKE